MGIFDKLFAKKSAEIGLGAPVAGQAVPLSEVSDPTFGEEIVEGLERRTRNTLAPEEQAYLAAILHRTCRLV